ncbi:rod shape-determining protein RodA [Candidatus Parcubacteria bacterium]|nr:rod shape-determining protein RodA [Candidatus Parcubacteria bacterium]
MRAVFRRLCFRLGVLRGVDWLMILSVFVLLLLGLAAIYSVDLSRGVDLLNVKKQLVAIAVGLAIALFLASSNYALLRNDAFVLYLAGILLLVGVLLFGTSVRGSRGWFVFDAASFQPVEFMKFALIVALSSYFSRRARPYFALRELAESLGLAMIPICLTLLQPDFGSAFVLLALWISMAFFAGMRTRFFLVFFGALTGAFSIGWRFFFEAYQRARILTFLNPAFDPLGQGYNVSQAIIAIGAGGWLGRGLGFGSQSQLKFLPESHTDFIFAVIAEELGFFGVLLLLGAFALLFVRLLVHAKKARDGFTAFLVVGAASALCIQLAVNIGMNLGMFPVTGIGLPLVSYGGSSLIFFLALLAVVQSVITRSRGTGGA